MAKSKKSTKEPDITLSEDDRHLAGVAGGIADYYKLSPTWVRIVGIVFIVLSGVIPGLIIYFVLAAAIKHGDNKS
jgi:phage shock protein PspC (stress-responsive transcriptional regulator)